MNFAFDKHWNEPTFGNDRLPPIDADPGQPTFGMAEIGDHHVAADDEPLPVWVMKITQSAFRESMEYLTSKRPETAGILVGPRDDDLLVTHFFPDAKGKGTSASFRLHTQSLNLVLRKMRSARLNCKGIVHSHPAGVCQPSQGDVAYLESLFNLPANSKADQFFMPIVCSGRLHTYVYSRGRVWPTELFLV